jgi:branched-chain amino acid transport system permease protein
MLRNRRQLWFVLAALAAGLLPLVLRGDYARGLAVAIGINTIVVLGLNLLMGYAGQVSLGQAAFVGIGAYTFAILGAKLHLSPWLGVVAAVVLSAAVAGAVGVPLLRLRGHYLAMGTLGFGIIMHIIMVQWESLTAGPPASGYPEASCGLPSTHHELNMYSWWRLASPPALAANDQPGGRAMRAVHGARWRRISGVDTARQLQVHSGGLAGLPAACSHCTPL